MITYFGLKVTCPDYTKYIKDKKVFYRLFWLNLPPVV